MAAYNGPAWQHPPCTFRCQVLKILPAGTVDHAADQAREREWKGQGSGSSQVALRTLAIPPAIILHDGWEVTWQRSGLHPSSCDCFGPGSPTHLLFSWQGFLSTPVCLCSFLLSPALTGIPFHLHNNSGSRHGRYHSWYFTWRKWRPWEVPSTLP